MAIIKYNQADGSFIQVESTHGVDFSFNDGDARRIANRLSNRDELFVQTTQSPDYTIAQALKDLERVLEFMRVGDKNGYQWFNADGNRMSRWSYYPTNLTNTFNRRGVYICREDRGAYSAKMKYSYKALIAAISRTGVYYTIPANRLNDALESGDENWFQNHPTFCPYTGETDAEKLHWLDGNPNSAFSYCWVSDAYIRRRRWEFCPECGHLITGNNYTRIIVHADGSEHTHCNWCNAYNYSMWCEGHHRWEYGVAGSRHGRRNNWYCEESWDEFVATHEIHTCEHCHGEIFEGDEEIVYDPIEERNMVLCDSCAYAFRRNNIDWANVSGLLSYSTKPRAIFYGDDKSRDAKEPLYIGFELELDHYGTRGGYRDSNDAAREIMGKYKGEVYCKSDGSLVDGCETVSMPHTIAALYKFDWDGLLSTTKTHFLSATAKCGLHTHISTTAFGETEEERKENIMKLCMLFDMNYSVMCKLARRSVDRARQWAKNWNYSSREWSRWSGGDNDAIRYRWLNDTRYHAVNLQNSATIEIRLWNSSDKKEVILATLDMAQAIVKAVCAASREEVYNWEEATIREKMVEYAHNKDCVKALLDTIE